ncbi:cellulose synthase [Thermasporomyces composti]|uniref:Cellulose synthase n=1 Tax=Thermasporomyces composti TaxID=696763 RepID=A0A3D9V0L0_THECX|nr:cellulose synthase [Thermasporomyces composti]REF35057.1 hypothetical protein DFJ64_0428 [Thermasporomyces composti]
MGFDAVVWFPICAGLTLVGLVAAFLAFRRRGAASGLRLIGWAVLPMAVYLTGMVRLLWTVGAEVVRWISRFAFSPTVWIGLALFGVAAIAFPVAAAMRRREARQAGAAGGGETAGRARAGGRDAEGKRPPKAVGKGSKETDPLEGMEEIEDILRRRGIT